MNKIADIVSKALSVLLYPLFVPTYGMVLFCYAFSHHVYPLPWAWSMVAVIGTLILTCILPVTAIWILIRQGKVTDMDIADAKERTLPYLYTLFGFGCWCYLIISILHMPMSIRWVSVGATVAIGLVFLINRKWKISAHLTGQGGLFGGLMSYYVGIGMMPSWGIIIGWLSVALLLMYARLHLNAHTPAQVCAGWLLGMACTFLPFGLISYVG